MGAFRIDGLGQHLDKRVQQVLQFLHLAEIAQGNPPVGQQGLENQVSMLTQTLQIAGHRFVISQLQHTSDQTFMIVQRP